MLVLTRKVGESIKIGDDIYIRVVQVKGKQVRIGVEAPRETKVQREELKEKSSLDHDQSPALETGSPEHKNTAAHSR